MTADVPTPPRNNRPRVYVVLAAIVLAVLAAGYVIGKDMALRDNARPEAASTGGA